MPLETSNFAEVDEIFKQNSLLLGAFHRMDGISQQGPLLEGAAAAAGQRASAAEVHGGGYEGAG